MSGGRRAIISTISCRSSEPWRLPNRPVLVACRDQEGKGYAPAEAAADKYHGVNAFDMVTGPSQAKANAPAYTKVFAKGADGRSLPRRQDRRHHRRHAAGTGLDLFEAAYPEAHFHVGIANSMR